MVFFSCFTWTMFEFLLVALLISVQMADWKRSDSKTTSTSFIFGVHPQQRPCKDSEKVVFWTDLFRRAQKSGVSRAIVEYRPKSTTSPRLKRACSKQTRWCSKKSFGGCCLSLFWQRGSLVFWVFVIFWCSFTKAECWSFKKMTISQQMGPTPMAKDCNFEVWRIAVFEQVSTRFGWWPLLLSKFLHHHNHSTLKKALIYCMYERDTVFTVYFIRVIYYYGGAIFKGMETAFYVSISGKKLRQFSSAHFATPILGWNGHHIILLHFP